MAHETVSGDDDMIHRIKEVKILTDYRLFAVFDDGKTVIYDVKEDIQSLPGYKRLQTEQGLFKMVKLDESRTCIYWSPEIDLPSDTIYEYGKVKRRKGENGLQ